MAATPSSMLALGTIAPSFELLDTVSGNVRPLSELTGKKGTVIMFICNHCPFVKHVNSELVALAKTYLGKGIAFVAISSNDIENYPADSPEKMKAVAKAEGYPFPYLYDATQEVAKAYEATCTPDFFLFDATGSCFYRGQLDDSRPGNGIPVSGNDLRNAIDDLLAAKNPPARQKPSIGCNIKWKKG